MSISPLSRRTFLLSSAALLLARRTASAAAWGPDAVIDIHQHTNYSGRSDAQLIAHQRAMGITLTVLLPAGSRFGLAAGCGGNETVLALARAYPDEFIFFGNEVAGQPNAREEISRYLKLGGCGIGEQKFDVPSDSQEIHEIAEIARDFDVPVLLHFQHQAYNTGLEQFHRILEKYPKVNFIGHAQTWWGNIDQKHRQEVMYPAGKVTPGGITDRLLADYPNMYGDLSAGSGLNALTRDEDHARAFLDRHQNKLLFGSDCNDTLGRGLGCQGAQTLAAVRRLVPQPEALRKILCENAVRVLKIRSK